MSSPSPLQQLIMERIQHTGQITFAEYMRMALYEPGLGYYVSGPPRMGWQGDYFTSTDLADFFAHCMGRQLQQMWEQMKQPTPFAVLEQGAGRGDLAPEIRSWAAQHAPDFSAALDYRTTDIRTGQDAIARDTNQAQQSGTPLPSPISSLHPSVILSNELVDAFPVHIVEKRASQLYEVYITLHDGRLYETLDEPSSPQVASYLDTYKIPWHSFDDGWRAEINLDALQWMEQIAYLLQGPTSQRKRRGFILTIDYGDKARALYTRNRPHGTLACYYQHQLTERPLARPGEQDITAHVNFTALINTARQHGLHLHTFTTQRQWLTDLGIYEELEHLRTHEFAIIDTARGTNQGQTALFQWYNLRQRVFSLTDPSGMGNFKVLILKR